MQMVDSSEFVDMVSAMFEVSSGGGGRRTRRGKRAPEEIARSGESGDGDAQESTFTDRALDARSVKVDSFEGRAVNASSRRAAEEEGTLSANE